MKNLARGLALLIMILPGLAFSLGLGEIDVSSALNQPLRAEINLLSVQANELQDLHVALASSKAFEMAGIERPAVLYQIQFSPQVNSSGRVVIQLTSRQPIREPFLNFLIEVQWPRGQLLREYTILLDPPVLMDKQYSVEVQAPTTVAPLNTVNVTESNRSQQSSGNAQRAAEAFSGQTSPASNLSENYETKRGDTLSKIASDLNSSEEVSLSQMMIAMLRANPHAFLKNNINELMAGVIMRAPTASELATVDPAEAAAEVSQHNALWREYRAKIASTPLRQPVDQVGQGKISGAVAEDIETASSSDTQNKTSVEKNLKILAAEKNAIADGSESVGEDASDPALQNQLALVKERAESQLRENEQLKSKIKELEEMLSSQEKLIDLQNDQLTELQQKLAVNEAKPQATLANSEAELDIAESNVAPVDAESGFELAEADKGETDSSQNASLPAQAEEGISSQKDATEVVSDKVPVSEAAVDAPSIAESDTDTQEQATQTAQQSVQKEETTGSLVNDLISNPLILAAIAVTGLLGIALVYKVMMGSRKGTPTPANQLTKQVGSEGESEADAEPVSQKRVKGKQAVESSDGVSEAPSLIPEDEFEAQASTESMQKTTKDPYDSGVPLDAEAIADNSDKDEVLTEAEVYIAYGMHDQAEDHLKEAIAKHPERDDYRLKLLEAYFNDQNQNAFDELAEELRERQGAQGAIWQQALAMGKKISPNNALYSSDYDPSFQASVSEESIVQDSGSGYMSDIVNEFDPEAEDELDEQVEFTVDEDNKDLEFNVEDLQLSAEDENQEQDSDFADADNLMDESLDFNLSDFGLEEDEVQEYQQVQDGDQAPENASAETLETNVEEGFLEGNESALTSVDEDDSEVDTQLIQDLPDFDVEIPLDEVAAEENDSEIESLADDETIAEDYDPSTEETQALDLNELGLDFSAYDSDEQAFESEDLLQDEKSNFSEQTASYEEKSASGDYDLEHAEDLSELEVSTTADEMDSHLLDDIGLDVPYGESNEDTLSIDQSEVPLDGDATELYSAEHDRESFDQEQPFSSEATESHSLDAGEEGYPEQSSTEIYRSEADDELQQVLNDLDSSAQETIEVSGLEGQLDSYADEDATEVYDPAQDKDLVGLEVPPLTEAVDSPISSEVEQEVSEESIPEVSSLEADETLGTEATETFESSVEEREEIDETDLESVLQSIPDSVSSKERDEGIDQLQEESLLDEVEDLELGDDSENQDFDVLEEVGTKLDLARAYIDMGDAEGARSTLEEVLSEGDDEQCREAEALMKQIA